MANVTVESKRLAVQLNENAEQYVSGELDLNETLDRTDELFSFVLGDEGKSNAKTSVMLHDSNLMKTQTRLAKQRARYYKPDSLVFNPTEFSSKLEQLYRQSRISQSSSSMSQRTDDMLWRKMGDVARKYLNTVPSFNFIFGTFDAEPLEVVKKKRKVKEKDKIGELTKPKSMNLAESNDKTDPTIKKAEKILRVFNELLKKNEGNPICYFEFVVDPTSFSRTVENVFVLSLLVNQGCIAINMDRNGLPCLTQGKQHEKKERNPAAIKQCIVTMTKEDWQDIVQTFKFKRPLIPPSKSVNT